MYVSTYHVVHLVDKRFAAVSLKYKHDAFTSGAGDNILSLTESSGSSPEPRIREDDWTLYWPVCRRHLCFMDLRLKLCCACYTAFAAVHIRAAPSTRYCETGICFTTSKQR